MANMNTRVAELETTCRAAAQGSKRRHDDQDDPDHHEGENAKKQRWDALSVQSAGNAEESPVGPSEQDITGTSTTGSTEETTEELVLLSQEELLDDDFLQIEDRFISGTELDMTEDCLRTNLQTSLLTEAEAQVLAQQEDCLIEKQSEEEPPLSPLLQYETEGRSRRRTFSYYSYSSGLKY